MSGSDGTRISEVFQPDFPNDFIGNKQIGRPLFLLSCRPFRLGLAVGCIPQVACLCFSVLRDYQWPQFVFFNQFILLQALLQVYKTVSISILNDMITFFHQILIKFHLENMELDSIFQFCKGLYTHHCGTACCLELCK